MAAEDFKVVIVGGGPVGLTAAHALDRVGIDFVLLERQPEIVNDVGSNLAINVFGLQALTQLGLTPALSEVSTPIGRQQRLDHAGQDIGDIVMFEEMKNVLGASPRLISRYGLISTLFNKLPLHAQTKCLPAKKLSAIQHTQNGVIASCTDGSSYSGNIIIGADGVHSATRDLMYTLDDNDNHEPRKSPFLTTFRCLWMRFPTLKDVPLGTSYETHGYQASTQVFAGEDSAVMGLYERLEKPTYERIRYTAEDEKAIVDRWGHLPLIPNNPLRLRDVYKSRIEAGLVSLEEGVMEDWSWAGRVVLVGDAAHKFTPSTGSGFNNGVLDVASLVSELAKTIRESRAASRVSPEKSAIQTAFTAYENTRRPAVEFECRFSGDKTQLATWTDEQQENIDKNVVTGVELQQEMIRQIADALTKAPTFDLTYIEQPAFNVHSNSIITSAGVTPITVH